MSSKAKSMGKAIYKGIAENAARMAQPGIRRVWEVVNTETEEIEPMPIALNANAIGIACMRNLLSESPDWTVIPSELEEGDELFEGEIWDYPYLEKDVWFVYMPKFCKEDVYVDSVICACNTKEEAKQRAEEATKDLGIQMEIRKS